MGHQSDVRSSEEGGERSRGERGDETRGTDSTEQQRCQLTLSQEGREREDSTHLPAPGCGMDTMETKGELNKAGREMAATDFCSS